MKRIIFIATVLFAIILSINAESFAQGKGQPHYLLERNYKGNPDGFSVLKNGDRVAFGIDYSSATIRGLSEQDNSDLMGKEDWEAAKNSLRKLFLLAVEESMGKKNVYLFGPDDTKSKYRIVFKVNTIDRDGDISGEFFLFAIDRDKPFASVELDGKGGRIGDFVNLMGDGHRDIGKDFGKFLKSNVSKKSAKSIEEYEKIEAEEKANEAARQELKNRSKAEKQAAKEERQRAKEAK
jgi:hypothetical protein